MQKTRHAARLATLVAALSISRNRKVVGHLFSFFNLVAKTGAGHR